MLNWLEVKKICEIDSRRYKTSSSADGAAAANLTGNAEQK